MRALLIIFLILFIRDFPAFSQVIVDSPIIMTSPTITERQVTGLGNPSDSADAVNTRTVIANTLNYNSTIGTNNLVLNLTPPVTAYMTGMVLEFQASATNTGPVTIDVNGLGSTPITDISNTPLSAGFIKNNQVVTIAFNGVSFQVISRTDKGCPFGFVEVNPSYCIEQTDHPPQPYSTALNTCHNLNARLCTWGEWYYACQKTSLGLSNMTNNYEYVDDTSDHSNTLNLAGAGTCVANSNVALPQANINYYYSYRCCFRK